MSFEHNFLDTDREIEVKKENILSAITELHLKTKMTSLVKD